MAGAWARRSYLLHRDCQAGRQNWNNTFFRGTSPVAYCLQLGSSTSWRLVFFSLISPFSYESCNSLLKRKSPPIQTVGSITRLESTPPQNCFSRWENRLKQKLLSASLWYSLGSSQMRAGLVSHKLFIVPKHLFPICISEPGSSCLWHPGWEELNFWWLYLLPDRQGVCVV